MSTSPKENDSTSGRGNWPSWLGLLALALFGLRTLGHADFWMRLASGRAIAEGGIQRTDPFTFTALGQPWVNTSWLYDRLLYAGWNLGGPALIVLAHMVMVTLAFALLVPVARRVAGPLATGFSLLLAAWLINVRFSVSPIAPALLLAALFIRVLSGPARPWALALLALLQVAWANVHSTFILGPFICALFAFDRWRRVRDAGEQHPVAWLAGLVPVCLVAGLLNPYGWSAYAVPFQNWNMAGRIVLQEWISPFSGFFAQTFFAKNIVTALLLVGAVGLVAEKRRLPFAITTLAVAGAFLAVRSLWHAEFFALLAFPFMALSFSAAASFVGEKLAPLLGGRRPLPAAAGALALIVLVVFSVAAAATNASLVAIGNPSTFGLGVVEEGFPEEALDLLASPGFPERVIHLPHDGGYLAWRLPAKKWFVDTRVGLFDQEMLMALGRGLNGQGEAWTELEARWKPDAVLLNGCVVGAGALLRFVLSDPRWALSYFDGTSAILLKRDAVPRTLLENAAWQQRGLQTLEEARQAYVGRLARSNLPAICPRMVGAGTLYMAMGRFPEARAVYGLLTRGAPAMTQAWMNLGAAHLGLNNSEGAIAALEEAGRRVPRNAMVWMYLSRAYEAAGMPREAAAALDKAQRLNPNLVMPEGAL